MPDPRLQRLRAFPAPPPPPRALSMVLAPPCPGDLALPCLYTSLHQYLDFIPQIITTPIYLTIATALVCFLQAE